MKERIQKILSSRGVASRRKAEEMIAAGKVTVNGLPAALGDTADPACDKILVDGKELPSIPGLVYIMLHKPRGYVTTLSDEKGRPTILQLLSGCSVRVYPVGRLDMDSEGLLLCTNDGELANKLMHPSHEIEKTYIVRVSGYSEEAFAALALPIELDGYRIKSPKLRLLSQKGGIGVFEITIHEGRNRQIRRMCETAGMKVLRLKRIREGSLQLGTLAPGQWRYLTESELRKIK